MTRIAASTATVVAVGPDPAASAAHETTAPAAVTVPAPGPPAAASSSPAGADLLRRHARTFHLAARLLPPDAARDLAVLYGFCRRLDDAVDEAATPAEARTRLERLLRGRERVGGSPEACGDGCGGSGDPGDPVVVDFERLARGRGIPRGVVDELVRGVASDLGTVRVANERELMRYAYRVAGAVGLMIAAVLDVPERAHPHAIDLGLAMQLTNIARDVAEDAARGRVYLPATWVAAEDVLRATCGEAGAGGGAWATGAAAAADAAAERATLAAIRRLLELAERHYRAADGGMSDLPVAVRPGILAASRNYEAIGARVARRGRAALRSRSRVGAAGKLLGVVRATASAGRLAVLGERGFVPHDGRGHEHLEGLPRRLREAAA